MRIVLLRHGRPDIAKWERVSASQFSKWVDAYQQAGIRKGSVPTQETYEVAAACQTKMCSNLRRSIDSGRIVCPKAEFIQNELFQEFELPFGTWHWPRLNPVLWSVIFRILWFLGYSYRAEPVAEANFRAERAAKVLIEEARIKQSVLLVGHYFLNRRIAKILVRTGWTGPTETRRKYWIASVFEKS